MNDRLPGAMMLSVTMHALVAGVMLLFGYAASLANEDTTKVFQIVAGEGDNFMAEVAPALGEPGGIKVDLPTPPTPAPEMVAVPDPTPVTPAPPPEKPAPKLSNLPKMIEKKVDRAEKKAIQDVAKERAKEEKKMSKKEFDERNKKNAGPTPKPAGPTKVAKLDPEGIRKGVVGGSTENKTGGAGGKGLVRDDGSVMELYFAMLQEKLRAALEKPPGLSDTLVTVVQVRIGADGSLTGAHITKSSGSDEFDRAAMAAVAAVRMPPRPDKKSEVVNLPFRMKEKDEG